jgi:hypothetical protein
MQEESLKYGRWRGDDDLPRMQQGNEGSRRKTAATSEGADIRQDLHEDRCVGVRKTNSRVFDRTTRSE